MCSLHTSILADAHALARTEKRRLAAEATAFERFVRRVGNLEFAGARPDTTPRQPTAIRTAAVTGEASCFREIRAAYRQTVLAVPHWQEVYGESTVPESLSAEFSADLVELVLAPGTRRESPELRSRLIEESRCSIRIRERTRARVHEETRELKRLDRALNPVLDRIDTVRNGRETVVRRRTQARDARARLERLLETHQSYLHGQPRRRYEPLVTSLYADLDVKRYPGLAAIAGVCGRLQRAELGLWAGLR
ncbi:hypothetical protein C2R22_03190 [Salinigranum rubrum]|uniref:DUF7260 domain-containing protein n=1 Tax=Salinigranum rubrum TaxID=755307 RepID=A0A2I8VFU2_9EURY|nr:hypothetical protein [Salinigranum rubrum]AUV80781.1 hypothetical protein C2R22_03190 [Salinigranum rubrum]